MPLSKRKRSKSWKQMLKTKFDLQSKGYELEIEEYVRKIIGEQRKEASIKPWLNYIKQEKQKLEQSSSMIKTMGSPMRKTYTMARSNIPMTPTISNVSPTRTMSPILNTQDDFVSTRMPPLSLTYAQATSRPHTTASMISRDDCLEFLPEDIVQEDSNHYHSPSQWQKIRAENLHAKSGKIKFEQFYCWSQDALPKIDPKNGTKQNTRDEDGMTSFGNFLESRRRRKLKGERPSALVYGRILDKPPSDLRYRSTLGLEQDKVKFATKDPSKILPVPTLDKKGFNEILQFHKEMDNIRSNLAAMEAEEMREYKLRRLRRLKAQEAANAETEEKIRMNIMRIKHRFVISILRAWNEHSTKFGKMRRFIHKTLYKWVNKTFMALKTNAISNRCKKRDAAILIQKVFRWYWYRKKFVKLSLEIRAASIIERACRTYIAKTAAQRLIRKHKENEEKVNRALNRIIKRAALKALTLWHNYSHTMKLVRKLSGKHGKARLRELFKKWKDNAYVSKYFKTTASITIQSYVRRMFAIRRCDRIRLENKSAISIQRSFKAYLVRTILARTIRKREELLAKLSNALKRRQEKIARTALEGFRLNHEEAMIEKKKNYMAFTFYRRMHLLRWSSNAAQWKKDRNEAACVLQRFARYIIGRNETEILRMEEQLTSVKAILNAQRNHVEIEEEEVDPFEPILDENGLPIIKTPSRRLIALLEEKQEVLNDESVNEFFDSKVLVFQQRFRMRANKKYLLGYIDSEIRMETKKIWNEEVAEIRAEHEKVRAMKEADKARRKEMEMLFTTKEDQLEDDTHADDEVYPTAGTKLWLKDASSDSMETALVEWKRLFKDGWMTRKTLIRWIARGLMDQDKIEGQVNAWENIRNQFDQDYLFEINKEYQKFTQEV